jgi:PAT family beta-lactamase induction signal transducer AmpG
VEGSQFTTYMALVNLVDIAGAYLSGQALTWVKAP